MMTTSFKPAINLLLCAFSLSIIDVRGEQKLKMDRHCGPPKCWYGSGEMNVCHDTSNRAMTCIHRRSEE
jgi:hypothetical protein